ncbi:MAG: 50S ribosomal protein L10 [Thermoleophilia bacterium]
MLKEKKEKVVTDLAARLGSATTLLVADYRGLTMPEIDALRDELVKHGARFTVCKNTLTRRAAAEAGVDALDEFLTGPTAIAFITDGDMVAVAKALNEAARTTRKLTLKGGVLNGRPIDGEAVKDLATLPPVDVLRGQVLGAIVAPLTSLLGLVSAPVTDLVGLIDARIEQLEQAGAGGAGLAPAAEEPAAPAEEVAAADEPAAEAPAEDEPEASAEAEAPAAEEPAAEEPAAEAEAPTAPENDESAGEPADEPTQ